MSSSRSGSDDAPQRQLQALEGACAKLYEHGNSLESSTSAEMAHKELALCCAFLHVRRRALRVLRGRGRTKVEKSEKEPGKSSEDSALTEQLRAVHLRLRALVIRQQLLIVLRMFSEEELGGCSRSSSFFLFLSHAVCFTRPGYSSRHPFC